MRQATMPRYCAILFACCAIWIVTQSYRSAGAEADFKYFRSDLGVASGTKPLPDDLSAAATLRWRQSIDSGHSTPLVCRGMIFFATYNGRELATVALDEQTGKSLWRRV